MTCVVKRRIEERKRKFYLISKQVCVIVIRIAMVATIPKINIKQPENLKAIQKGESFPPNHLRNPSIGKLF